MTSVAIDTASSGTGVVDPSAASRCEAGGAALAVASVAGIGGLVDHGVIAVAYPTAFAGVMDRVLFVVGLTALQTGFAGIAASVIALVVQKLGGATAFSRLRFPVVLPCTAAIAYALLWLNSFVMTTPRALLLLIDVVVFVTVLALLVRRLPVGMIPKVSTRRALAASTTCLFVAAVAWVAATTLMPGPAIAAGSNGARSQVPPDGSGLAVLPDRTNILMIVADTLRGDHLGYAGYVRETSPNLDMLAARSVVFERAVAQATRTSPNMASLMTATTPLVHGIIESRSVLPESLLTLAEITQEAGFFNYGIVGNPNVGPPFGHAQGMDRIDEMYLTSQEPVDAGVLVDRAIDWLAEGPREPFMLWVHFIDPHTPYGAPEPWRWHFRGDALFEEGPSLTPEPGSRFGGLSSSAAVDWADTVAEYIALYDGEIRYMDSEIGRLLEALELVGLTDHTLIVFTSDHGESLGEHDYYFSHGDYTYEPTAHVPLILSHPGLDASVENEVVRTIDVMPTVLDMVGLTPPQGIEGRSLIYEDPPYAAEIAAGFAEYTKLAVRIGNAKLIMAPRLWRDFDRIAQIKLARWPGANRDNPYRRRSYRRELYDLSIDVGETNNLAGTGHSAEAELHEALLAWIDSAPEGAVAARLSAGELDPRVEEQLRALGYIR